MLRIVSLVGSFIILLGIVVSVPVVVQAQVRESSLVERQIQIERLLREVARLQVLLDEARAREQVSVPKAVYESRFFDFPFEAVYYVGGDGLERIDRSAPIRQSDQELYDLLIGVVGEDQLRRYVDDFRVFNDSNTEASAFVESKAKSDYWIFGVNRDGWRLTDRLAKASFIDLFLHEYAHLLLLENEQFTDDFADRFWTEDDEDHAQAVKNERRRFRLLEAYYEDNEARFVSDYATMSVDEDIAETFVQFVITARPAGSSVREQKIRFFYESPDMVAERTRLRQNLRGVGVSL